MSLNTTITDEKLVIGEVEFLHKQARDNCKCEICWNPTLQQRRNNPPSENITVIECHIDRDTCNDDDFNIAHVLWSDGHQGILHFGLNVNMSSKCTADSLRQATNLTLWKSPFDNNMKMKHQYDYSEVIKCPKLQYEMFQTFFNTGIIQISNAPLKNENNPGLVDIADKLGQ